jgi:hypothetical protein
MDAFSPVGRRTVGFFMDDKLMGENHSKSHYFSGMTEGRHENLQSV